jgi:hypothetical protein
MTTPIVSADAARLYGPAPGSLPDWFTTNRVHGHTRLDLRLWEGTTEFLNAAAGFRLLGAHAFARHVKRGEEDPWWPSGEPPPPNPVKEFIDNAHAQGLKIFAYYWHMSEERQQKLHPDWVCRDQNGDPIETRRKGPYLDMTGPYGDLVLNRLRELAMMGADALFFDARHLPPQGSWQGALADAWQASHGASPPPLDPADPLYQEFLDFKAAKIEETFVYWREQVRADFPNVVFIISTTTVPALTDCEMTTRLARIADSSKNEYRHALNYAKNVFATRYDLRRPSDHVRQALGWTVLRDAADGRPPHIWARGVPNSDHAQAYAGSLLTFGCVANMDAHETALGNAPDIPDWKTPVEALKAAFDLGSLVSPHMAGTKTLRWAAVHFSERIRNEYVRRPPGADFVGAWRNVLWPLMGAFQVLTEEGVPVGVVNDEQLQHGDLDGYRVLILPNAGDLSHAQQLAVTAFRTTGGIVIENDPAWRWSDKNDGDAAAAAFRTRMQQHIRAAPLRVSRGPAGSYAVAYRAVRRLVVAVTNNFNWVQIRWTPNTIKPAAPPATGLRVTWRKDARLVQGPSRFVRLQAVEAISGKRLRIVETNTTYSVALPQFDFMALVVVTPSRTLPPRTRKRRAPQRRAR